MGSTIDQQRQKIRAKKKEYQKKLKLTKKEKREIENKKTKELALKYCKHLVKNATEYEKIMIAILKNYGVEYSFQVPLFFKKGNSFFIADFVVKNKLGKEVIIEIDGGYHNDPKQKKKDASRTSVLKVLGYKVVRFKNDQLIKNFQSVYKKMKKEQLI